MQIKKLIKKKASIHPIAYRGEGFLLALVNFDFEIWIDRQSKTQNLLKILFTQYLPRTSAAAKRAKRVGRKAINGDTKRIKHGKKRGRKQVFALKQASV